MKKSELYHEAALAVMRDTELHDEIRLEIIAELLLRKKVEQFCESQVKED